ncbi:unnamed protein product [Trifolium pratense]|uniref:Uncharacterized protein n=1 Tax=Trifolium pratense TaxID=57577 RepID=A0ACB0JXY3_TRIPR|nr:unnamed protein product [Trifolium pratense]
MAYYNSSYSGSDYYGENNFNSYAFNYNYSQVPSFMTYNNNYDYNQQSYAYDSSSYSYFSPNNNNYHDHSYNNQTIAYSTTTFSDPKYLVYDPNYGMTQLVLSYSTLEFNEPAFDEYDPTPYGGGYDIDKTYGKPLSPSDQICYPRSGTTPIPVPVPVPIPITVPLPVEETKHDEKVIIPQNVTNDQVAVEKPQLQDSTIKETSAAYEGEESEDSEDYSEENDDDEDDYNSGSSYGGGFVENEIKKEVEVVAAPPQYPSGYGLEAMDICESLFGYWPCLAKMKRENCCGVVHRGNNCEENMWKGTADYLFGNPYPYDGRRDDDYGGGYGYERY